MLTLRPYQQEAVEAVYRHLRERDDNPCVVLPTGTGKGYLIAQVAADAVKRWDGRVIVLAHVKELLEQNAEKLQALCPDVDIGIYSAGLNSRDTERPVIIAGIQSVYKRACELGRFDLAVVDECVPAGTMVSTPRGDTPIEDLYVGQPVHTAMGVGEVEAISARTTLTLLELEFENGKTVRCTPNHPFFTEQGWREAKALEVGSCLFSREDMQALRNGHSPENILGRGGQSEGLPVGEGVGSAEVLLGEMRSPDEEETAPTPSEKYSIVAVCADPLRQERVRMLRENLPPLDKEGSEWQCDGVYAGNTVETAAFLLDLLLEESREPHVGSGHPEDCFPEAQRHGTRTSQARWKRSFDRTADSHAGTVGTGMAPGTGDPNGTPPSGRYAHQHQGRHSESGEEDCCRTGRAVSSGTPQTQCRQAKNRVPASQRVVRITPVQCQSPVPVFNLQVEGHPSFYADGVLAHNCHLIPEDGEGMYRTFLEEARIVNPNLRIIGLTATPYRMKGGLICAPENVLNHVCYEAGIREMIVQGYLSPLRTRSGRAMADLDSLHIRAGEFIASEVEEAMDTASLVHSACSEIVELAKDRNSVLIFTSGVDHCRHVAEELERISKQECGVITGSTPSSERAGIIARFRGERISNGLFDDRPPLKFLANVNVLTTGFDATNVDCIVLLRPTNSPGLYVQMVGRGTRLHPGKQDCLVLDYGGNVLRHGPVDAIQIPSSGKTGEGGSAPAKECPECSALVHAAYSACPECGYEFPRDEKNRHDGRASSEGILSGEVTVTEYPVQFVYYSVHHKRGAPPDAPRSMRVEYQVNWQKCFSEWICFEHTGFARHKAELWWKKRSTLPVPKTAEEAVFLAQEGAVAGASSIVVRSVTGEKYDRITGYDLDSVPDYTPEPGMYEEADGEAGSGAEAGAGNEVEEEPEYSNVYEEEPPF